MPRTEQAARLTDAYRARLLTIRQQVVGLAVARWGRVTVTDLDGTFDAWVTTAATLLAQAQRTGVTLSDAYLAAFLAAELERPVPPAGLDPDAFAGVDRAGQPLPSALAGAIITTKVALRQGRNQQEALRMGRNRAVRVIASEALAAPRDALSKLMAEEERVKGWRRLTAPGACGACLASTSGRLERKGAHLKTHRFCRCQSEPVVDGVREVVRRPTGREIFDSMTPAEQAALFHGRGGEEKARLVRSGEVPFEALIAPAPMKVMPDDITEVPLTDLASRVSRDLVSALEA
jgi:hypothetical protein